MEKLKAAITSPYSATLTNFGGVKKITKTIKGKRSGRTVSPKNRNTRTGAQVMNMTTIKNFAKQ